MEYLSEQLVEAAYAENNFLGGIVAVMNSLGVIGTEEKKQADMLRDFLRRKNIPHNSAPGGLIWLESLEPENLKEVFINNNKSKNDK